MIDEECKFLHPASCRKYMENPEISCRAHCKGYHPELCKYSRVTRECYNDRCFRIHLKAQANPTCDPGTKFPDLQINNKLWSPHKIWLTTVPPPFLTLPTQHTTATHPAASPTQYHTPPSTQYLTTHQTTVRLYHNPPPLHAIPYTTSSILNSCSISSSSSNIFTRTPNTLSHFSPYRSKEKNPSSLLWWMSI